MKDEIHPTYPETLVDIKTIPGLDYIKEEKGTLKIGALAKLAEVADSNIVKNNYAALEKAADAAVKNAIPLSNNKHKVQIANVLVKRAISGIAE